jgi:hypothetical protein
VVDSSIKSIADEKKQGRFKKSLFGNDSQEFRKRDEASFEIWEGQVKRVDSSPDFKVKSPPKLKEKLVNVSVPSKNGQKPAESKAKVFNTISTFLAKYRKASLLALGLLSILFVIPFIRFKQDHSILNNRAVSNQIKSKSFKESVATTNNVTEFEGWSASYEPIVSRSGASLVYLPSWLGNDTNCTGNKCLPAKISASNKVCIETKFSQEPGDTEISVLKGYYGAYQNSSTKILSFDKLTAAKHGLVNAALKKGVSWKIVDCPV